MVLANGVRVVLKPTDFAGNEVLFSGFSPGGTSLANDEDFFSAQAAGAISNSGVGTLDQTALEKALSGKSVQVFPFISEFEEGVGGRASAGDLETMFQLIYLRFTAPRADEDTFQSAISQRRRAAENRALNPTTRLADAFNRLMTGDNPRRRPMTVGG